ncbi:MAG: hypothetical protein S4CHLAM45_08930 [Chlamydiales bacterium]|nr:hypothetical protein [Chlamydiales bacterium]MCH9620555.1 hypothetical protein [Chlamydiales bacterium]MCH9622997.1 hypothetical protein [Chlamydiales bacterium]
MTLPIDRPSNSFITPLEGWKRTAAVTTCALAAIACITAGSSLLGLHFFPSGTSYALLGSGLGTFFISGILLSVKQANRPLPKEEISKEEEALPLPQWKIDEGYKSAFKKMLQSQRFIYRLEKSKRNQAATKIQAAVRGFLTRQAALLKQKLEEKWACEHVLRLMSWTLQVLAESPEAAAAAMKEQSLLPTEAFNTIAAKAYQLLLETATQSGMSDEDAKSVLKNTLRKLNACTPDKNINGYSSVSNTYLAAIAFILLQEDETLVPLMRTLLNSDPEVAQQLQKNGRTLLTSQFVANFKRAALETNTGLDDEICSFCEALKGIIKTGDYTTPLRLKQYSPLEARAHELRLIAHAHAYNHVDVGHKMPGVGEVIYRYRGGGVNYFVAVDKRKVHFCSAGTHEAGGLARDLDPRSAASSFNAYMTDDAIFEMIVAIYAKFQDGGAPVQFEFHGHSLGGHDVQLWANKIMHQMLSGQLQQLSVKSVLINTQNALRVNWNEAEEFHTLTQELLAKSVAIKLHHGFVPYDMIQHAGAVLIGHKFEELGEGFEMTIVKHHCNALKTVRAMATGGPHRAVTAATQLVFVADSEIKKIVLTGGGFGTNGTLLEGPVNAVAAAVKVIPWAALRVLAYFKAADSQGRDGVSYTTRSRSTSSSSACFTDAVTGKLIRG